jgi:hypothetical protein
MKIKLFGEQAKEFRFLWEDAGAFPQIVSAEYNPVEGRPVVIMEVK